MMTRTTFITVEVQGPKVPISAYMDSFNLGRAEYERVARLFEKANTYKRVHRPGAWKPESVRKMAERGGAVLVEAHSIARDSKGFIQSSKKPIC
jgi:hypothetical protein